MAARGKFLFHGDSADNAQTYAAHLREALEVRVFVKPDPGLFADRRRRGGP
jgi:hypothetical protein